VSADPPELRRTSASSRPAYNPAAARGSDSVNLAELLERVLDKGIVIAGDVRLYLGGIELLTLKIRLVIASVDKAQEIGINWWESDPALSAQNRELRTQRDELSRRLDRVEAHIPGLEREDDEKWEWEPALSAQNRELRIQRDELQERLERLEARLAELNDGSDDNSDDDNKQTKQSRKKS
jgi:hypothetical protein